MQFRIRIKTAYVSYTVKYPIIDNENYSSSLYNICSSWVRQPIIEDHCSDFARLKLFLKALIPLFKQTIYHQMKTGTNEHC